MQGREEGGRVISEISGYMSITVEPLNDGTHSGTDNNYRRVVLIQRQKCIATINV